MSPYTPHEEVPGLMAPVAPPPMPTMQVYQVSIVVLTSFSSWNYSALHLYGRLNKSGFITGVI